MALNGGFSTAEHVFRRPSAILSGSISPVAIKLANDAVKSTLMYA